MEYFLNIIEMKGKEVHTPPKKHIGLNDKSHP